MAFVSGSSVKNYLKISMSVNLSSKLTIYCNFINNYFSLFTSQTQYYLSLKAALNIKLLGCPLLEWLTAAPFLMDFLLYDLLAEFGLLL